MALNFKIYNALNWNRRFLKLLKLCILPNLQDSYQNHSDKKKNKTLGNVITKKANSTIQNLLKLFPENHNKILPKKVFIILKELHENFTRHFEGGWHLSGGDCLPHMQLNVVFSGNPKISRSSWMRKENVDSQVPMKYLKKKDTNVLM